MGRRAISGASWFILIGVAGCGAGSPPTERDVVKSEAALTLACGEPRPGVYDAYPGPDADYALGPASSTYRASPLSWPGEQFEGYAAGSDIECQSAPSAVGAWDVITVNQCLEAAVENGNGVGSIETDTLRVLATGTSAGKRIGWTDQTVQLRAKIRSFSSMSAAAGIRIVAHYQTENDFYVASLRKDGYVRLEKRCGGSYSPVASSVFYEVPSASTWYTLKLSVTSSGGLSFSVSGGAAAPITVTGSDTSLPWGTAGFRADDVRAYVDDWYVARDVRSPSASTLGALQSELGALSHGGVLLVPAGTYSGSQTLSVPADDVAILGTGSSASVIQRDTDGTVTPLLEVTGYARTRISGLKFVGYAAASSLGQEVGIRLEDASDFRVDHSAFTRLGFAGVQTSKASRGVIDHSDFRDEFKTELNNYGYGVCVFGTNLASEHRPYGTPDATFVEDSTFQKCRHAVTSNKGARYVFRHNAVSLNRPEHPIDSHGQEYPEANNVGTEWADIYNNTVTGAAGDYLGYAIRLRGGGGVIHDNQINGFTVAVRLTQATPEPTKPINIFSPVPSATFKVNADAPIVVESAAPPGYTTQPYPHPLTQ